MENVKADCVADTSTIISLVRGGNIDCLGELFRKVYIPEEVKRECKDLETAAAIQKPFFQLRQVKRLLPIDVDIGELGAISLAVELGVLLLLTNDRKAIKEALEYNLHSLLVSDILVLSKEAGCIHSVENILDTMKANGELISKKVYLRTLEEAGEL